MITNANYDDLIDLLRSTYWLCDLPSSLFSSSFGDNQELMASLYQGKRKKITVADISLEESVRNIYETLNSKQWDMSAVVVHAKRKHERRKQSNRRSNFIGVSKNGPSWQAMITVNKHKTYIGTYKDERDAAIAFDFYSTLIYNMNGKTNFR